MIVKSKDKTRYGKEDFDREEDLLRKRLKEIDRTEKYGQEIPKINKMNDKISLPEIMVHKEKKFLPEPLLGKKYPFFEISNLPQKQTKDFPELPKLPPKDKLLSGEKEKKEATQIMFSKQIENEKKFLPEPLLGKKYPFFEISNLPQKEDASTQPAFSKQVGKEDASTQPAFSKQVGKENKDFPELPKLPPQDKLPSGEKTNKEKSSKMFDEEKEEEKAPMLEATPPKITYYKIEKSSSKQGNKELIEKYDIEIDGAKVTVEIDKEDMVVSYNLYIPEVSSVTSALLTDIRNDLVTITTISMKELTDPTAFFSIKGRFMEDARKLLRQRVPNIEQKTEVFLVGMLMQEMLGLGKIEFLIADPNLEEIVLPSAKEPVRVYCKKYGWLMTNLVIHKEEDIINYANIIARRVGKQITILNPLLDAHLITGDRINAVLYPVDTKGNTITIRKFARDPFTIVDFINNKTCDIDVACLLWLAIEYEMNILISGGTGSGKTSFLNACMPFIPPNQRIISIEDTRELMLPEFLYWTPLVTRTPNPEGKGEVSMLDLLVNCLRMRPDRVILGEMRRQQEAMVLFEAMHTGHSVYATVHADTSAETISRLVNPPLNVPPNLLKAVNLNVVMFRDRRKGIRRVSQIAEFEADKGSASSNILYRWVSETDKIVKHGASSRFFEDVSRNTGMSDTEIAQELAERKKIFLWLEKENIRGLAEFGKVMNLYYRNKDFLLKSIQRGDRKAVLK